MLFSKKLLSKAAILLAAGILSLNYSYAACADGGVLTERQAVTADALASRCSAETAVLYEANTESFILECESEKSVSMGHFAKLMTVYLTAEKINSGELTLEDTIKASQKANSQTGTVIWLDAGEEIPVSELLKSVIIGNANDGCVALAEGICGDEKSYVEAANNAAASLDLKATHFEDITGMTKNSVTCAKDIAKLCGKLLEYDFLQEYFVTWIDEVRGGKTQLVNTNRLVKSYNGIRGMKACASDVNGNCLAAAANRNGMDMIAVIIQSETMDTRFSEGRDFLDYGFNSFELYKPEISEEITKSVQVKNGEYSDVGVAAGKIPLMLIPKGSSSNVSQSFERKEYLTAPVKKGEKVGLVRYVNADGVLFETDLYAKNDVDKMSWGIALKRLLLNLLKLG